MARHEKIIVCNGCEGIGKIHKCRDVGTHHTEWEYTTKICKKCKGSGRLMQSTEILTQSYDPKTAKKEYR